MIDYIHLRSKTVPIRLSGTESLQFELPFDGVQNAVVMPCGTRVPLEGVLKMCHEKGFGCTVVTENGIRVSASACGQEPGESGSTAEPMASPITRLEAADLCSDMEEVRNYFLLFSAPGQPSPLALPYAPARAEALSKLLELTHTLMDKWTEFNTYEIARDAEYAGDVAKLPKCKPCNWNMSDFPSRSFFRVKLVDDEELTWYCRNCITNAELKAAGYEPTLVEEKTTNNTEENE